VITVLLLAALMSTPALGAAPAPLAAGPPTELWEAFPLEPAVTQEAPPADPGPGAVAPLPTPAPEADGSTITPATVVLGAAIAVAALGGLGLLIRRRRRSGFKVRAAASALQRAPEPARLRRGPPRSAAATEETPEAPAATPPPAAGTRPAEPPAEAREPVSPPPDLSAVPEEVGETPGEPTRELARLAADYLDLVAAGSTRPVLDLAEQRGWSPGRTRTRLGRARAAGVLMGAGRGRAGGTLSEEARALLDDPPARPLRLAHSGDRPRPSQGPDTTRREAS
jgi:hypothetical protein